MPSVTTQHTARALSAALQAVGGLEKLGQTTSAAAIGAMNWAAWEYSVQCKRRLEIWQMQAGKKVPGSHQSIYDTRPESRPYYELPGYWDDVANVKFKYGGAHTGRLAGNLTATQVMAQQQVFMSACVQRWHDLLHKSMDHWVDLMAYGMIIHKRKVRIVKVHDEWTIDSDYHPWGTTCTLKQPKRYERAGSWQSNLTGSGPSLSDTLLHAPDTSRSEGNKSKAGWLSRMPRSSTGWSPGPRTRPTPKMIRSQPVGRQGR